MMPISAPCTMKIAMIDAGDAPSVRRIAMSACLSVTTITCADTMLNAATATISVRMMNITRFSICDGAEEVRVIARPVAHFGVDTGSVCQQAPRDQRRGEQVVELEPHAGHAVEPVELLRVVDVDRARARCRTRYMPTSNSADDLEALDARQRPGRRDRALRRDHDDRIAEAARPARARARRPARCRIRRA